MDDIELYDIYDIWYEPSWFVKYSSWLGGGFLIVLIVLLGYYTYRKKYFRKKNSWVIALEKLEELNNYVSKDHKLFYFNLTAIIKEYLKERYTLDVCSKTDLEMVEFLTNPTLPHYVVEDLKKIFSDISMVKFANHKVNESSVQEDLIISIRMVKNTIPKEH